MSEEIEATLGIHHPAIQALVASRVNLMFNEPEIGSPLMTLELVVDNSVEFIKRDGRRLLFNVSAVAKAPPPKLEAAMRQLVIFSPTDPQME